MARRRGRNYLRALRERIATLEARLWRESTVALYILTKGDGTPHVEDYIRVLQYVVTNTGGVGQRVEYSAELVVSMADTRELMEEILITARPVQFMGRRYVVTAASGPVHNSEYTEANLTLRAIA